jgi:hypothetical protein
MLSMPPGKPAKGVFETGWGRKCPAQTASPRDTSDLGASRAMRDKIGSCFFQRHQIFFEDTSLFEEREKR